MATVKLHELEFGPYLTATEIQQRIGEMAGAMAESHADKCPLFLGVLNGAFMFAADLLRACDFPCEISFIKLSSYQDTVSSGDVKTLIGLNVDVRDRHLIIVEDIVDSGRTMHQFVPDLQQLGPASIAIATLLSKPEAHEFPVNIDFVGFEIPPDFVVGYGMDYNGLGRNLPGLYQLIE
ncbi:hypoxanthine phosphoribosyltransferase [Flavilitoribacter nigricans]|uniref:Hypoxanthine phosphoribosyltransferase n=1 Tax=Flavilitoribacter nigricans (strain ATCC 23147 / DSM 23189 / NBRC 102662 / NCIMB 1420 / SS-2) TaxID=1122177 RepID=A0A2D0N1V2_FLAN2|nr:hypoxanthine phosphoribosyltransferase [Flavilitoribacter nigricans]PHN01693.1 hypoxanthine phosphoribosyltransferase [Flavilitoribacter nigricans DSM 23189 = NBRC 102662]